MNGAAPPQARRPGWPSVAGLLMLLGTVSAALDCHTAQERITKLRAEIAQAEKEAAEACVDSSVPPANLTTTWLDRAANETRGESLAMRQSGFTFC